MYVFASYAKNGGPSGIRTQCLSIMSRLLIPNELPALVDGAGDGNRTRVFSLEGCNNSHYTTPA